MRDQSSKTFSAVANACLCDESTGMHGALDDNDHVRPSADRQLCCALQKQSASLKAYKRWFKALLESSQALVDGRNEAADLDKELKLREKDLQVPLF